MLCEGQTKILEPLENPAKSFPLSTASDPQITENDGEYLDTDSPPRQVKAVTNWCTIFKHAPGRMYLAGKWKHMIPSSTSDAADNQTSPFKYESIKLLTSIGISGDAAEKLEGQATELTSFAENMCESEDDDGYSG